MTPLPISWTAVFGFRPLVGILGALTLTPLSGTAQRTLTADGGFVRGALAACQTDLRWINQIGGWQVGWTTRLENQPVDSDERRTAALELWRTAPAALAEATDSLRAGIRAGHAAPRLVIGTDQWAVGRAVGSFAAALARPAQWGGGVPPPLE